MVQSMLFSSFYYFVINLNVTAMHYGVAQMSMEEQHAPVAMVQSN